MTNDLCASSHRTGTAPGRGLLQTLRRRRGARTPGARWLAAALLCALPAAPAAAQTVTLSVPAGTTLAEGVGSTDIVVTATASQALDAETTITLTLGGTAAQSSDYTVDALPSITIAEGQTTGEATVVLSPVDDGFHEQRYETVTIDGSAAGLTVTGASVDLTDNDTTRPRLSVRVAEGLRVPEGWRVTRTVTISLLDGVLEDDLDGNLSLEFTNRQGASPPDKIETDPALPTGFTIAAGSTVTTTEVEFNHRANSDPFYFAVATLHASADFLGANSRSPKESQALFYVQKDTRVRGSLRYSPGHVFAGTSTTVRVTYRLSRPAPEDATLSFSLAWSWVSPSSFELTVSEGSTASDTVELTYSPPSSTGRGIFSPDLRNDPEWLVDEYGADEQFYVFPAGTPELQRILPAWGFQAPSNDMLLEGSIFVFDFHFSRPVKPGAGTTATIRLDSGPVRGACAGREDTIIRCTYTVQRGDYDFDPHIRDRPWSARPDRPVRPR